MATTKTPAVPAAGPAEGDPAPFFSMPASGGRTSHPGGLTPAELRIAELVGQGRSNKEVAAELVVTVRTVESNLTRIYRKLDVRSRAELAHRLSARDPAEPL